VQPYPSLTGQRILPPGFDDAATLPLAQVISNFYTGPIPLYHVRTRSARADLH
jgi:hypothetical protein